MKVKEVLRIFDSIPMNPQEVYKGKGWKSEDEWIGIDGKGATEKSPTTKREPPPGVTGEEKCTVNLSGIKLQTV